MLIHVKVIADSNTDKVELLKENSFVVYTKSPRENNQANRSMIQIISKHLQIPTGKIRIITGHHQPSKILEIKQ